MKIKTEQKCSPSDSQSHIQNVVELLYPFWVAAASFAASVAGGVVFADSVDPAILWTPVGICGTWLAAASIAGGARVVEYLRVLRYLRLYGVRSVAFNFRVDALFHQLNLTKGRRKVLAAGLTTLRRPAMYAQTMHTFNSKGLKRFLFTDKEWWVATFNPANIIA